jgi:hypothetical protein
MKGKERKREGKKGNETKGKGGEEGKERKRK